MLDEARKIRNAIAHTSVNARQQFEILVRQKLGTLSPNLSVGGFLATSVSGITPPMTFLEFYTGKIEAAAHQIVPS